MSRKLWRWGRFAGSALVFAVLVWRLGTSPFLAGFAPSTLARWRQRPAWP